MVRGKSLTVNNYNHFIDRLYQTMTLQYVLNGRSGHDYFPPPPSHPSISARRSFLNHLAFLCDGKRGGDTVTSLALEDAGDRYVLWISQNKPIKSTVDHLQNILTQLKTVTSFCEGEPERRDNIKDLERYLANFSKDRIKKTKNLLRSCLSEGIEYLRHKNIPVDELTKFHATLTAEGADLSYLCQHAYTIRKTPAVRALRNNNSVPRSQNLASQAHHFIGRLAAQHRAVHDVVEYWHEVSQYLDPIEIKIVPILQPHPRTLAMKMRPEEITIRKVLTKHYDKKDIETPIKVLENQDTVHKYFEDYRTNYKKYTEVENLTVHCEINMVEHFYWNNLNFVAKDRYIAVSKPTCRMCNLYLKHHPLKVEDLPSRNNMWLGWSPPLITVANQPGDTEADRKAVLEKRLNIMRRIIGNTCPSLREDIKKWLEDPQRKDRMAVDSFTLVTEDTTQDGGSNIDSDDDSVMVISDSETDTETGKQSFNYDYGDNDSLDGYLSDARSDAFSFERSVRGRSGQEDVFPPRTPSRSPSSTAPSVVYVREPIVKPVTLQGVISLDEYESSDGDESGGCRL